MSVDTQATEVPLQAAQIVREYGPFDGDGRVHGVSHDGERVWAAVGTALVAFDPATGRNLRRLQRASDAGDRKSVV